jgi:hypothetical protein
MGLTLEDINKGAADIGGIISKSLDAWRSISGQTSSATPTVAASNQPAVNPTEQTQGVPTSSAGVNWLILVGVAFLVIVLLMQRR